MDDGKYSAGISAGDQNITDVLKLKEVSSWPRPHVYAHMTTELSVDGVQETIDSLEPESETNKWADGNAVGRYAASLREIVNEAMEPNVPAKIASVLRTHNEDNTTYTTTVHGQLLWMWMHTQPRQARAAAGGCRGCGGY